MDHLIDSLKRELKSEVRFDAISKRLYSVDASIYEVDPIAIVLPRTKGELVHAVELASHYGVAVIARGAATGIAGGCLGRGLVIDTSKYLNKVIEIDYAKRFCVVQPGVIPDRLNELLKPHGLYFAPEISTSNRCTIGGMVASNAAGANSLKIGKMQDHLLEVELALWNGETLRFTTLTIDEWKHKLKLAGTEGRIYRHLEHIRNEFAEDIARDFPKTPRRASGYNLDVFLEKGHINVAALICGSEGTFGVITECKLKLTPLPKEKTLVVIGYNSMYEALISSHAWSHLEPEALEMIDRNIIEAGRVQYNLDWLEGAPDALIMWEFIAAPDKVATLLALAKEHKNVLFAKVATKPEEVWQLRKAGLGLLLSKRSYSRAIAFIEDVAVPPEQVAPFVTKLRDILTASGKEAGLYGHIGAGCLHARPYIDLRKPEELAAMQKIMHEVATSLKECGGVFSGEHGDGRVRSWTNQMMFGPRLYEAMSQLKRAFDPYGIMNPGKVVASQTGLLDELRLSPQTPIKEFATYMDFTREGGFSLAVDLCNGNGQCRKKEQVMCPSYQATHDEKDSTRARAQLFRSLVHGQLHEKDLHTKEFHDVMDLCLQCKGCKKECPSQIDMAKIKSEYLYRCHKTWRSKIFSSITTLFRLGSYLPTLTNWINSLRCVKRIMGIAEERQLPKLAPKRFSQLFTPKNSSGPEVVLFIDSFTEFLTPHIGLAAAQVLESLGYKVIAPAWTCCGRPEISKGYLPEAKKSSQTCTPCSCPMQNRVYLLSP